MTEATILALIAILGTTMAALFKLLDNNTKAVDRMVVAMQHVAKTNTRIADESRDRNGHLAEITIEARNAVISRIDGLTIEKQTVHNQVVEHETVQHKNENS
jgi:hypothetical protein